MDDLNEEDWPSQYSFRVDSDFENLKIGSSHPTKSEREAIVPTSSSTSSRRSSVHKAVLEKAETKREVTQLTQQLAEMHNLLAQMVQIVTEKRVTSAAMSIPWQKTTNSANATIITISNDAKVEPMTLPTKVMGMDPISLDTPTMAIADSLPVYHAGEIRLHERNLYS